VSRGRTRFLVSLMVTADMGRSYPQAEKHLVLVHNNRAVKCGAWRSCEMRHETFELTNLR
jgi:hypothetical protein